MSSFLDMSDDSCGSAMSVQQQQHLMLKSDERTDDGGCRMSSSLPSTSASDGSGEFSEDGSGSSGTQVWGEGFTQHEDEDGRVFYHNAVTGEWLYARGDEWSIETDESGHQYWYNRLTGESQWVEEGERHDGWHTGDGDAPVYHGEEEEASGYDGSASSVAVAAAAQQWTSDPSVSSGLVAPPPIAANAVRWSSPDGPWTPSASDSAAVSSPVAVAAPVAPSSSGSSSSGSSSSSPVAASVVEEATTTAATAPAPAPAPVAASSDSVEVVADHPFRHRYGHQDQSDDGVSAMTPAASSPSSSSKAWTRDAKPWRKPSATYIPDAYSGAFAHPTDDDFSDGSTTDGDDDDDSSSSDSSDSDSDVPDSDDDYVEESDPEAEEAHVKLQLGDKPSSVVGLTFAERMAWTKQVASGVLSSVTSVVFGAVADVKEAAERRRRPLPISRSRRSVSEGSSAGSVSGTDAVSLPPTTPRAATSGCESGGDVATAAAVVCHAPTSDSDAAGGGAPRRPLRHSKFFQVQAELNRQRQQRLEKQRRAKEAARAQSLSTSLPTDAVLKARTTSSDGVSFFRVPATLQQRFSSPRSLEAMKEAQERLEAVSLSGGAAKDATVVGVVVGGPAAEPTAPVGDGP